MNLSARLLNDLNFNKKKHLWLIPMDDNTEKQNIENYLTQDELIRSNQLRFADDRKKYVFFHSALRIILSQYCFIKPHEIEFIYNEYRKPFIKNNETQLSFNFSHSNDLAICGLITQSSIGSDIEFVKGEVDFELIANTFFSEKEKGTLENIDDKNKLLAFYSFWTGKEAYGKALGCGINFPLHKITIPNTFSKFMKDRFLGLDGDEWEIERYILKENSKQYVISCVSDGAPTETNFFIYNSKRKIKIKHEN